MAAPNEALPKTLAWWERYAKRMIRILFIQEGAERRREHITMENYYYAAIYDILQDTHPHDTTAIALQQLKARIVRIIQHAATASVSI